MSTEIAHQICQLAAELADEIENAPDDSFTLELKATCEEWSYEENIVRPVTLIFGAQWVAGEWKMTTRQRIETWDTFITDPRKPA